MTAEEIRNIPYNTQQEKIFLEMWAQMIILNENFGRLLSKIEYVIEAKEKKERTPLSPKV